MLLRLRQVVTTILYSTKRKPVYSTELIYKHFPEVKDDDNTPQDYDYMLEKLKDAPLLIPPDKRHSLSDVLAFIKNDGGRQ